MQASYCLLILGIAAMLYVLTAKTETFAYPGATRCTDGCIYRPRNSQVYVDEQCQNMCVDKWDSQGYNQYMNSLFTSINDGAFVYKGGLLGSN